MASAASVYVGLGSNLDHPRQQIARAFTELAALPETRLLACSSLYKNPPMGPADQPDYINAVAQLQTLLTALDLLVHLQHIEQMHDRRRDRHWGPRSLDLDLLLYNQEQLSSDTLTVPHPGIGERNFVLYPLAELAPELVIPGLGPLVELLDRCCADGLVKLADGTPATDSGC